MASCNGLGKSATQNHANDSGNMDNVQNRSSNTEEKATRPPATEVHKSDDCLLAVSYQALRSAFSEADCKKEVENIHQNASSYSLTSRLHTPIEELIGTINMDHGLCLIEAFFTIPEVSRRVKNVSDEDQGLAYKLNTLFNACLVRYIDIVDSLTKEHISNKELKKDIKNDLEHIERCKVILNLLLNNKNNAREPFITQARYSLEAVWGGLEYMTTKDLPEWHREQMHDLFVILCKSDNLHKTDSASKIYSNLSESAREFLLPETRDLIESTAPKS